MSTRRVTVAQGERHAPDRRSPRSTPTRPSPELADPPPAVPGPDELPAAAALGARRCPRTLRPHAQTWVERPPPLDLRIGEAPNFLGGLPADGARSHWMRLPRDVGDDPLLHAALLAYASDYLLLDMAFRSHPERDRYPSVHRLQPRPRAVVPPPGALRPVAPPHAGDAGHLGPPRACPGHDPRRRRASRGQRHAGGAGPPRTLSTPRRSSSASTVTRR